MTWWDARVAKMDCTADMSRIMSRTTLHYIAQHGKDAERGTVPFLRSGTVRVMDNAGRNKGESQWRHAPRQDPGRTVQRRGGRKRARGPHRRATSATWKGISSDEGGSSEEGNGDNPQPSPSPRPPAEQEMNGETVRRGEHGIVGNVGDTCAHGVALLEARVRMLECRVPTEFMTKILNEMRVEVREGIITELLRQPRKITVRREDPMYHTALHSGFVTWSMSCSFTRFKLFLEYIHTRFNSWNASKPTVRFFPDYNRIMNPIGVTEAQVCFSTAGDFLDYLNVTIGEDVVALLKNTYECDGQHVRVLGGTEKVYNGERSHVRFFPGRSCVASSMQRRVREREEMDCGYIMMETTSWDEENTCFTSDFVSGDGKTGFTTATREVLNSFNIRWVTEKQKVLRRLNQVVLDREGVRMGKVIVQLPCITMGPALSDAFSSLCGTEKLLNIFNTIGSGENLGVVGYGTGSQ